MNEGSHHDVVDGTTDATKDVVVLDYDSIKTAKNLSRIFSLEEKLKEELTLTQDEFCRKIPYLLMEVRLKDVCMIVR